MKKPKVKYYYGQMVETNGERQCTHRYLFKTAENPEQYNDTIAKEWSGHKHIEYDKDSEGYYADCGCVHYKPHRIQAIPQAHFAILKKYLVVL